MFDRRLLTNFDWSVLLTVLFLITCGIVIIYSATHNAGTLTKNLYARQIYWALIAFIAFFITITIDYHRIARYGVAFYILNNLLLLYLLMLGSSRAGVNRWISFGGISFQPSEFMKIILVLILAEYLARRYKEDIKIRQIAILGILTGIPFVLVLKQPDLGSAILLIPIFVVIFLVAQAPLIWLISAATAGCTAVPIVWQFLKPYQVNRILSFMKPNLDPLGMGYQVLQSRIAVGSGGILGQGFLSGTQSQLRFIPQHHTDFIFSVLAEEWGFIGCMVIIVLFLFIILKGIDFALHAKDRLGALIAMGIVSIFTFHVIINIGMVIGLMPVTGIPLPFLSYGGTSLVSNMTCIGLLLNIQMRRFS